MAYGYNVGRITTAGNITEFNVGYSTYGIVAGSDGNVWFTSATFVGRITPAGSITTYAIPTQYSDPGKMTLGLDQNVWFVENLGKVGRVTMTGNITEFSPSSGADGIATGSDGNLWFTEGDANKIGRITTSGSITEFDLPVAGSFPYDIAAGPDGNLWFTESNRNVLGRITP
jgi:streptogramin lyase